MKDCSSRRRSMVKALTWRILSVAITTTLVLLLTGNIALSAAVGGIDSAIKLGVFYYHERLWHRIKWGKNSE